MNSLITVIMSVYFFFFNDTATTEIYTLSLHDALPILPREFSKRHTIFPVALDREARKLIIAIADTNKDRKSTRLNSSHGYISYAVFCLKKKKNNPMHVQHHHRPYIEQASISHDCSAI